MNRRPNGTGSVFKLATGKWAAEITAYVKADGTPVKKRRTARTQTGANSLLEELKAQYRLADTSTFPVNMTVEAWSTYWVEHQAPQTALADTTAQYAWLLEHYVLPKIGRIELRRLRTPDLVQWQAWLVEQGYAPGTVKAARGPLSAALNHAARLGLITMNPLAPLRAPRKRPEESRSRWLTETEMLDYGEVFARHEDRRLAAYVLIIVHRGLRKEEVTGLRWSAIDFTTGEIDIRTRIRREKRRGPDGKYVTLLAEGPLKSSSSYRRSSLNGPVENALRAWRREQAQIQLRSPEWPDHDLVFTTASGKPVDVGNLERAYKAEVKRTGLRYVSFHDLRRSVGYLAYVNGATMTEVKGIMGHASTTITEQIYVGRVPGDARIAAEKIDLTLDPDNPPNRLRAVAGDPQHDRTRPNPTPAERGPGDRPQRAPVWGTPTRSSSPVRRRPDNSHKLGQSPHPVHTGDEPA